MIERIEFVKNFGIFRAFDGNAIQPFGKYNLIYGWNGSGKSTLSLVFESLEKRECVASGRFPRGEFKIKCADSTTFDNNSIQSCNLNIRTFNADFIKENIDWSSHTKSLLMVAKEKIEERKELDSLRAAQSEDAMRLNSLRNELQTEEKALSKFLSDSAKTIKINLKIIDTSDNRFLNYDKTKFETFLQQNEHTVKDSASIVGEEELLSLTTAAKPDKKESIPWVVSELSFADLSGTKEKIAKILAKSIVNKTIERLAGNSSLQTWVETGLSLHGKEGNVACEFCGNIVSSDRLKDLEGHFSKEYVEFKDELTRALGWMNEKGISLPDLPAAEKLYPELVNRYSAAKEELELSAKNVNAIINSWIVHLQTKQTNPFETNFQLSEIAENEIQEFNLKLNNLTAIISEHNLKTADFEKSVGDSKKKIELHYAADATSKFDYFSRKQGLDALSQEIETLKNAMEEKKGRVKSLEASLVNEERGAKNLNDALHRFLGREDISLVFNKDKLGYEIHRGEDNRHSEDLSEGEKTAIAFVLFVLKLEENNNHLKKTIVVIDDPVSSFDSNHLFHAYSFLRKRCEESEQIFVMTHNFTFFRRVCDWFYGVNRTREGKKPPKSKNAFFYILECCDSGGRSSKLVEAPDNLVAYHSEYHYLFSRLCRFIENESISLEESYVIANLSRRILESFLAFKFPKYRSDFAQLLDKARDNCEGVSAEMMERLKRFTDRYSHSNVFEVDSESIGNLVSEGPQVVSTVLKVMEELDPLHYKEMLEVVQ
ncbi:MAG: AAA family ATPase [Bdellovibrionota bacterium]